MCFVPNAFFPIGNELHLKSQPLPFRKQKIYVYGLCFTKHLFEKIHLTFFISCSLLKFKSLDCTLVLFDFLMQLLMSVFLGKTLSKT